MHTLTVNGRSTVTPGEGHLTVKFSPVPRPLLAYYQLTSAQRATVDYMGDLDESNDEHSSPRFVIYRGSVYDTNEFEIAPDRFKAQGFDGWQTESYFSAVLLRYFDRDGYEYDGGDSVVVGYAHW